MDPISSSPLPPSGGIRPAQALQGDLASILRQGRIVAGEVLDLLDGRSILIGLGGQRVQAENHVDLAPGERFLARVEYVDGALVLQLPGGADSPDDALLAALRRLAGSELDARSVFELLQEAGLSGENLPAIFRPEDGGAGLAALVRQSGLFQESALRAVAADAPVASSEELALDALAQRILAEAGLADAPERSELAVFLREALRAGLDELGRSASPASALDAGLQLRAELVRTLGPYAHSSARALVRAYLAGLDAPGLEHAGWLPWIALLLGERLDFGERGLRRRALLQLLQEDFKARLVALAEGQGAEPEREAAGRALRALEAEQLRNLARAKLGEPLHAGFLVPEGAGVANAHLYVPSRRERSPGGAEEPGEQGERITIGAEFSRLGPLRAELLLKQQRLHVRLCASRPATVALLERELDALVQQLSGRGLAVSLAVVQQEPDKADPAGGDLGYLREHHLMDLCG